MYTIKNYRPHYNLFVMLNDDTQRCKQLEPNSSLEEIGHIVSQVAEELYAIIFVNPGNVKKSKIFIDNTLQNFDLNSNHFAFFSYMRYQKTLTFRDGGITEFSYLPDEPYTDPSNLDSDNIEYFESLFEFMDNNPEHEQFLDATGWDSEIMLELLTSKLECELSEIQKLIVHTKGDELTVEYSYL